MQLAVLLLAAALIPMIGSADSSCSIASTAMQTASEIRGLRILHTVPCRLQDRAGVERYLREKIAKEYPEGKLKNEERVYKLLGLIPLDYNYVAGLVKLYTDQLGGYYDPDDRYYVMASWMPEMLQMSIAVHELTHALQDQHFNLTRFLDQERDPTDVLLARAALVEGDATAVMLDYARRLSGQESLAKETSVVGFMAQNLAGAALSPSLHEAPPALQSLLIFPYLSGLNFAHRLLRTGDYPALSRSFRTPPSTTEEILHPEKYLRRNAQEFERLPDPPAPSGSEPPVYADVLGEFTISTLLSTYLPPQQASRAASGWGGDRLALYGGGILIWRSRWDDEREAIEFFNAFADAYRARFKQRGTGSAAELRFEGTPVGSVRLSHNGAEVLLTISS